MLHRDEAEQLTAPPWYAELFEKELWPMDNSRKLLVDTNEMAPPIPEAELLENEQL